MKPVAARPLAELEGELDHVRAAPADVGTLELIVARPDVEQRSILDEAELDVMRGLVGDNWEAKPSQSTGAPKPDAQVTVMSARVAANLPPGAKLAIGASAVLEVTAEPHLGCGKFVKRFGVDALKLLNSATGRELRLRGVNTRVAVAGTVRVGDEVRKA